MECSFPRRGQVKPPLPKVMKAGAYPYSQRTLAGTLSYVAPEMILGQAYGRAVDIWVGSPYFYPRFETLEQRDPSG